MVMSWGGYSFIINLLPIHCLASVFTGRLSARLYVAYAPIIVFGTLLAASIPVVGFNAILMSEHFGAFLAFGVLHAALLISWIHKMLPDRAYQMAKMLLLTSGAIALGGALLLVIAYVTTSPTFGWTGRSLSLLDPTYASKYIPIIASVSEHQPPAWPSYFTDIHILVLLLPAGFIACFRPLTDASLFLLLYGLTSVYFSGVMVRLMLVLAPAACCLGGVALSSMLSVLSRSLHSDDEEEAEAPSTPVKKSAKRASKKSTEAPKQHPVPHDAAWLGVFLVFVLLVFYSLHSVWVSAEMYSAPSIVLQTRTRDGGLHVFDDFREAYSWLRHNTEPDSKVASWWDYGYQATAMANRTVIVDNNTWNNTHIATVGRAMSSPEKKAWKIYQSLDVDYVFVIFGGYIGYPSDDINKFLWMVRIGGGVFPEIQEKDYLDAAGSYRIDSGAGQAMLDSLMYQLTYYRFADASVMVTGQRGYDRVRNAVIGKMDVKLKYFEEAFTSEHWMVRIYKVKKAPNRDFRRRNPQRRKAAKKSTAN
ncbi:unnamed protein product [Ostreobium quekettii]|uniref:dolichyl-diphosphooligosaccharide--protein glycotransferase n=1 Tax=Ostreobium quekettii TaxID=121088 RepID=A0A8S1J6H1_9CHLO|nr:unnamed protein product [Ostreobium quekettii]